MDPSSFDELTKALATPTSRRQALKTFAATALAGMLSLSGLDKVFAGNCTPNGHKCQKNKECCSRLCDPTTSTCVCPPLPVGRYLYQRDLLPKYPRLRLGLLYRRECVLLFWRLLPSWDHLPQQWHMLSNHLRQKRDLLSLWPSLPQQWYMRDILSGLPIQSLSMPEMLLHTGTLWYC